MSTDYVVVLQSLLLLLQETCYQYWSKTGVAQFGEYTVDLVEERDIKGYIIRKVTIYNIKVYVHCS